MYHVFGTYTDVNRANGIVGILQSEGLAAYVRTINPTTHLVMCEVKT